MIMTWRLGRAACSVAAPFVAVTPSTTRTLCKRARRAGKAEWSDFGLYSAAESPRADHEQHDPADEELHRHDPERDVPTGVSSSVTMRWGLRVVVDAHLGAERRLLFPGLHRLGGAHDRAVAGLELEPPLAVDDDDVAVVATPWSRRSASWRWSDTNRCRRRARARPARAAPHTPNERAAAEVRRRGGAGAGAGGCPGRDAEVGNGAVGGPARVRFRSRTAPAAPGR